METTLSVFFGVLASLVSWALLTKGLRPRLAVRTSIVRSGESASPNYRFAIRNQRQLRSCFDLTVTARLGIHALDGSDSVWKMINLPVDDDKIPFLSSAWAYRRFRRRDLVFYPQSPRLLTERFAEIPELVGFLDPSSVTQLEDVLALGDETILTLIVTGVDSFSGSPGMWVHEFDSRDIRSTDQYDRTGSRSDDNSRARPGQLRAGEVSRYESSMARLTEAR